MKLPRRLDLATLAGFMIAGLGLFFALKLEGISLYDVGQITAALVVFGGTTGAVLVSMPPAQIAHALKVLPSILTNPDVNDTDIINQILNFARARRARGFRALEQEAEAVSDSFFRRALQLSVDAVDAETIKSILNSSIEAFKAQAENDAIFYETAAGYAPTLGVAGAALGLVQVMKNIEHLDQVGRGVAAAFVATIYGVLLANLILLPIATKIRAHAECHVRLRGIIREGVLAITAGMNPALIRLHLDALAHVPPQRENRSAVRAISA